MATGDSIDLLARVKRLIPFRWFQWAAPLRDAIVGGLSDCAAHGYSFILYARQQSRLATATGIWLDILCYDYLRRHLLRRGTSDTIFRATIQATILQERVTRKGMNAALTTLLNIPPFIFEPWNTNDAGAYGVGTFAYGFSGGWGSIQLPGQVFIKVSRLGIGPSGTPNVAGYYKGGAPPPTQISAFTTFDPAFLDANATLSNGNLTVTDTGAVNTTTRSILFETTGKFYAQFTCNAIGSGSGVGVGICNGSQTTGAFTTTLNGIEYFSTGSVYINGVVVATVVSFTTNDVIDMAVDIANKSIWFRKNGGIWNNNGAANPATNVGGISFASLNSGVWFAAVDCNNGGKWTVNFGAIPYAHVVPSGFLNWAVLSFVVNPFLSPNAIGGYGQGSIEYISGGNSQIGITDADIYQMIANTKPSGVTVWTQIGTEFVVGQAPAIIPQGGTGPFIPLIQPLTHPHFIGRFKPASYTRRLPQSIN